MPSFTLGEKAELRMSGSSDSMTTKPLKGDVKTLPGCLNVYIPLRDSFGRLQ